MEVIGVPIILSLKKTQHNPFVTAGAYLVHGFIFSSHTILCRRSKKSSRPSVLGPTSRADPFRPSGVKSSRMTRSTEARFKMRDFVQDQLGDWRHNVPASGMDCRESRGGGVVFRGAGGRGLLLVFVSGSSGF